jgi:dTMP kinase
VARRARTAAQSEFRPCYHNPVDDNLRGRFITFEGLDGSGKSTQIEKLAGALRSLHLEVLLTREPGGTSIGESIRHMLLDSGTQGLLPETEMALMFAARAQHLRELILPTLAKGHYVLCDRFTDSTEAYQGGGRELGSEVVLAMHRLLCNNIQPDLTLLLDCDLTVSLARAKHRNLVTNAAGHADENRFEMESRAFFGRVHDSFLAIAEREPKRVALIDARGTPVETHAKVLRVVRERLHLADI